MLLGSGSRGGTVGSSIGAGGVNGMRWSFEEEGRVKDKLNSQAQTVTCIHSAFCCFAIATSINHLRCHL